MNNSVVDYDGLTCFRPLSGKWGYRYLYANYLADNMAWFPSPLGEMGLSMFMHATYSFELNAEFPSPLGEMGLSMRDQNGVFKASASFVSVPSRGNGVIDRFTLVVDCAEAVVMFPSPLGEMGLSIFRPYE